METLRSIDELSYLPGPIFLAIGVFDGVHRGHQAVISTSAQEDGGHCAATYVAMPTPARGESVQDGQAAPRSLRRR